MLYAIFDGEGGRKIFFVHFDLEAFELLPKRVQNDQTRDVGRVARSRGAGAAEGTLRDAAVRQTAEDATAMLEPNDLFWRIGGHRLDRVLVAQVVRTFDAVERMVFRGVVFTVAECGIDAALRGARMAAHRVHFRNDCYVGAALGGFNGGAHSGEAAADDHNIVLDQVYMLRPRSWAPRQSACCPSPQGANKTTFLPRSIAPVRRELSLPTSHAL